MALTPPTLESADTYLTGPGTKNFIRPANVDSGEFLQVWARYGSDFTVPETAAEKIYDQSVTSSDAVVVRHFQDEDGPGKTLRQGVWYYRSRTSKTGESPSTPVDWSQTLAQNVSSISRNDWKELVRAIIERVFVSMESVISGISEGQYLLHAIKEPVKIYHDMPFGYAPDLPCITIHEDVLDDEEQYLGKRWKDEDGAVKLAFVEKRTYTIRGYTQPDDFERRTVQRLIVEAIDLNRDFLNDLGLSNISVSATQGEGQNLLGDGDWVFFTEVSVTGETDRTYTITKSTDITSVVPVSTVEYQTFDGETASGQDE